MGVAGAMDRNTGRRNHTHWLLVFFLSLLSAIVFPAHVAASEPFVMGTDADERTFTGKWYRRIYDEAFKRMGVPLTLVTAPTARLTYIADEGNIDGQASRVFAYADAHPDQLRVDESVHNVRLVLHAFGLASQSGDPRRLEDLAAGTWRVEYRRGVAICEKTLTPVVPAELLSDVTNIEQGLKKLKAGRTDLYCDFDLAVMGILLEPSFKGETGYRQVLDLNLGLPLYPYVHKSRSELAPRLAETLRKMKAEGLVDRYQKEVVRELEAAR